jgi:hypothetical protein
MPSKSTDDELVTRYVAEMKPFFKTLSTFVTYDRHASLDTDSLLKHKGLLQGIAQDCRVWD